MGEEKIEKDIEKCCAKEHRHHYHDSARGGDVVYCFGFIGAVIFFIGQATTFWMGVLGFLKAIVWPAFLVYEALKFLIK